MAGVKTSSAPLQPGHTALCAGKSGSGLRICVQTVLGRSLGSARSRFRRAALIGPLESNNASVGEIITGLNKLLLAFITATA